MPAEQVPTDAGKREAIARALCMMQGLDPEARVIGITGREWARWEQMAIHVSPGVITALEVAGYALERAAREAANGR